MTCGACGSAALAPHLHVGAAEPDALVPTSDRFGHALADLVRCVACGHAQVERMPDEAELAAAYGEAEDPLYASEESGQRLTAGRALDRIERHAVRGSLCDVGCWTGVLADEATRRGWRAFGIEPSRAAAAEARGRGVPVAEATLAGVAAEPEVLPGGPPEGGFDAVVMADVIEHLPEPVEALREAGSLMGPGGVIYLALPDAASRTARMLGARWWSVLPTHLHYFSRESLTVALGRAGFRPEWEGRAPKALSVGYYAGRLSGYSPAAGRAAAAAVRAAGVGRRLWAPDLRDRMAVVARLV